MYSFVTEIENQTANIQQVRQKLADVQPQLKQIDGFSHCRLIPNVSCPETCLLLTFWKSRAQAYSEEVEEIICQLRRSDVRSG